MSTVAAALRIILRTAVAVDDIGRDPVATKERTDETTTRRSDVRHTRGAHATSSSWNGARPFGVRESSLFATRDDGDDVNQHRRRATRAMSPPLVPFVVCGTKKGSVPFARVKTKYGKTHTRIDNCSGDVSLLLSTLTRALGCGGSVCDDKKSVVIAFDESFDRIVKVLKSFDPRCVRGVRGAETSVPVSRASASAPTREPRTKPRHGATGSGKGLSGAAGRAEPIVITKRGAHESAKQSIDGYRLLLSRWPYWDGDVSRMYDMYHRHRRRNDDVVMSLDVDSILQSSATDTNAMSDFDRAAQCASTEDALRTLGMLAMPSEFRQSRLERQREAAKRKESVARVSSGPKTSSAVVDIDPFAEYLQHDRGFAPARVSSKPAGASSPPPSMRTAKPARRPTGGSYTNSRKHGASTSVSRLARVPSSESDDDIVPARRRRDFDVGFRRTASGKFTFGGEDRTQTRVAFEPQVHVAQSRNHEDDFRADIERWPQLQPETNDNAEDEQIAEAIRLSKLEFKKQSREHNSARAMHIECDELFGDMTEEEIVALVVRMSQEETTSEADLPMPTKTEWVNARLGEIFFPDIERARQVAEIFRATETDRNATIDLLIGAGAAESDAKAFWELFDAVTLTDNDSHVD